MNDRSAESLIAELRGQSRYLIETRVDGPLAPGNVGMDVPQLWIRAANEIERLERELAAQTTDELERERDEARTYAEKLVRLIQRALNEHDAWRGGAFTGTLAGDMRDALAKQPHEEVTAQKLDRTDSCNECGRGRDYGCGCPAK